MTDLAVISLLLLFFPFPFYLPESFCDAWEHRCHVAIAEKSHISKIAGPIIDIACSTDGILGPLPSSWILVI